MFKCNQGCGNVIHDPIAHTVTSHPGNPWHPIPDAPSSRDFVMNTNAGSNLYSYAMEQYWEDMRRREDWIDENFDSINFSVTNG